MAWLTPVTLSGHCCTLERLTPKHHDELSNAVQDGQLWNLWYTLIPKPDGMSKEIDRRLALLEKGTMLPFTIINKITGKAVGMTTFLNADSENRRIEIGGTWIAKSQQRTGINTEAKLLLLTHAFEELHCNAVEFRTNFLNHQSRKGIERLGAKLDGILRNHMIMPDHTLRDTCVYSILTSEWAVVKNHLTWLMNKPR